MLRAVGAAGSPDLRNLVRPASRRIFSHLQSTTVFASRSISASSRKSQADVYQSLASSQTNAIASESKVQPLGLRDGPLLRDTRNRRSRSNPPRQRQGKPPRLTAQQRDEEQRSYELKEGRLITAEEAWQAWDMRRKAEGGIANSPPAFRRAMSKALLSDTAMHSNERLESIVQEFQDLRWASHTVPFLAELIRREHHSFAFKKLSEILSDPKLDKKFELWSASIMLACHAANNMEGSPLKRIVKLVRPMTVRFDVVPRLFVPNLKQARTHLSGCPLLTSIRDTTAEFGGVAVEVTEDDKRVYQHAVLAWGLDDVSKRTDEHVNVLSERIKQATSTGADAGNHGALLEALEILPEAEQEWLSVSCIDDPKADWNAKTWSSLLKALLSRRDNESATKVWALYTHLNPAGRPVHSALWNGLLSGYSAGLEYDRVNTVWEQMRKTKDAIDQHCYTTMISVLFRTRQPFEAQLLYQEMLEWCKARKEVMPVESMNNLIHGLAISGRLEDAAQMVTDMIQTANPALPKPNIGTINTMLRAYGRNKDLEGLVSALRAVEPLGLQPDVVTFTTVLDAFGRMGKGDHVSSVYNIMVSEGSQGNTTTFSALIKNSLDNAQDRGQIARFDIALSLLHRMEVNGPKPNEVTYTNVIAAFFDHSAQVRAEAQSGKMNEHFGANALRQEDFRGFGITFDAVWLYRPELVLATVMVKHMVQRGMVPNRKTFNSLFEGILRPYTAWDLAKSGLSKEGDQTEAIQKVNLASLQCARAMLKRMQQSRLDTTERILRLLVKGISKFARLEDDAVTALAEQLLEDAKDGVPEELLAKVGDMAKTAQVEAEAEEQRME